MTFSKYAFEIKHFPLELNPQEKATLESADCCINASYFPSAFFTLEFVEMIADLPSCIISCINKPKPLLDFHQPTSSKLPSNHQSQHTKIAEIFYKDQSVPLNKFFLFYFSRICLHRNQLIDF